MQSQIEYSQDADFLPHLYLQQMARATRALSRYAEAVYAQDHAKWHPYFEVDDYFHALFQAYWHVKDWLQNDSTVSVEQKSRAIDDVHRDEFLKMVRDLANGTKHLTLTDDKTGAHDSAMQFPPSSDGKIGMLHVIGRPDGREITALDLARLTHASLQRILSSHSLPYIGLVTT